MTPLYPQKLALTSPTGGGRSVGIVRSRSKATEFLVLLPYEEKKEMEIRQPESVKLKLRGRQLGNHVNR